MAISVGAADPPLDASLLVAGTLALAVVSCLWWLYFNEDGTVFGPIDSIDALFGTGYGITWLVALLVSIALVVNGARNIGPASVAMKDAPDFAAAGARLQRFAQIDLVGFAIVFTCMILMRFGP